jgi:hypothetical protein
MRLNSCAVLLIFSRIKLTLRPEENPWPENVLLVMSSLSGRARTAIAETLVEKRPARTAARHSRKMSSFNVQSKKKSLEMRRLSRLRQQAQISTAVSAAHAILLQPATAHNAARS